uniref:Uncharacterized protein n=1 Tax=Arundo donax TaxID=35708 RepID=A0A0A9ER99_ARUDO
MIQTANSNNPTKIFYATG